MKKIKKEREDRELDKRLTHGRTKRRRGAMTLDRIRGRRSGDEGGSKVATTGSDEPYRRQSKPEKERRSDWHSRRLQLGTVVTPRWFQVRSNSFDPLPDLLLRSLSSDYTPFPIVWFLIWRFSTSRISGFNWVAGKNFCRCSKFLKFWGSELLNEVWLFEL